MEGLTALPDKLLLGVRELGTKYDRFDYKFLVLELPYEISSDAELVLGNTFRTVLDFVPATGVLFLLSSYELDERLGAYLWCMNANKLDGKHTPALMRQSNGKPLHFSNKAEGMTIIAPETLFVTHDDDRVLGGELSRLPHQAAYSVVNLDSRACLMQ